MWMAMLILSTTPPPPPHTISQVRNICRLTQSCKTFYEGSYQRIFSTHGYKVDTFWERLSPNLSFLKVFYIEKCHRTGLRVLIIFNRIRIRCVVTSGSGSGSRTRCNIFFYSIPHLKQFAFL